MAKKENPEEVLKRNKLKIQIWSAVSLVIVGCVLLLASFIIPPTGYIDPSVLTALGELFTFAGSLFGLNANYKIKLYREAAEFENKYRTNDQENED